MIKKLYIVLCLVGLFIVGSCAKADKEYLHDDCEISSIDIMNFGGDIVHNLNGVINQETGEITFPIPRSKRKFFDLTKLYVRANIGYDAYITPSLVGLKDLSEDYKITVTAKMTGRKKTYTLRAYYSRTIE